MAPRETPSGGICANASWIRRSGSHLVVTRRRPAGQFSCRTDPADRCADHPHAHHDEQRDLLKVRAPTTMMHVMPVTGTRVRIAEGSVSQRFG